MTLGVFLQIIRTHPHAFAVEQALEHACLLSATKPTRLAVVRLLLEEGEQNVTQLVAATKHTHANVSKHLKQLLKTGMAPREVAQNLGVSIPTLYRWVPASGR